MAEPSLPDDDPDAALVERAKGARGGDTRAFDELIVRHRSRVVANCRYLTSANEAEDLAQEVLVKAYFALRKYESRARFSTWLYRIKVNHCLNHRRAERRRDGEMALDDAAPDAAALRVSPDADQAIDRAADVSRVRAAVAGLPETLRQALVMRELDEMSYDEIALALGVSLSAVKMRILRARQELRTALGADGG
ncbi:MAG: sigma-70 family RNA polymerase sigma factor [Acidobacteria bacterium]|nr:sigma-70 family RNA polymerase sigma factor [Acidobacteriota bacterium]